MTTIKELHTELDRVARNYDGYREPLRRDPALWKAFAPDRARRQVQRPKFRYSRENPPVCEAPGCSNRMRPRHATLEEYPGTVRLGSRGVCDRCYKRSRSGGDKR